MNDRTALATQEDFGGTGRTMAVVETASTAIAAQSKAMVESLYIMAMRNPRNWDQVRLDLVKECRRPSFANNKSAYYVKPIGQGVEGLGIRFVEVALRCMKNVLVETTMIFEDEGKEVHRVSVTDLEANITYPLDVRVSKTVERSKPMDVGSFISMRLKSYKKPVYTVPANDDDLLNKRGALISKAIRTIGLRIIPGDMCDEAEEIIKAIRLDKAAKDQTQSVRKSSTPLMVSASAQWIWLNTSVTALRNVRLRRSSTCAASMGRSRTAKQRWQPSWRTRHHKDPARQARPERAKSQNAPPRSLRRRLLHGRPRSSARKRL